MNTEAAILCGNEFENYSFRISDTFPQAPAS